MTYDLFIVECAYCNVEYRYKAYRHEKMVLDQDWLPPGNFDNVRVSHGICEPCKPEVYRKNGLEYLIKKEDVPEAAELKPKTEIQITIDKLVGVKK